MKIRIKFSKTGAMRYVGHLDTMHYFQKAFRRTGLKIAFSKGFSPHMLLTFASPLAIGMTTSGDYLDIVLDEDVSADQVLELINEQLSEGFEALQAVRLREEAKTPMALLRAASYLVSPACIDQTTAGMIFSQAQSFMGQDQIVVTKKTKKGETAQDIRPLIYRLEEVSEGSAPTLSVMAASGSIEHLKPDLIISALVHFAIQSGAIADPRIYEENKDLLWHYHRTDLYGVDPRILKPGDPLGTNQPEPLLMLDI